MKVECEIYSRVSGYYRPVKQWNKGKQSEFKDRREMVVKPSQAAQDERRGEVNQQER